MANWVRYPSPFSERFPHEEHAKWRCDTPPQKGYLSDTGAIPYETKANGCDTPLCDTISKGYCAIWGGISHWAAKFLNLWFGKPMVCVRSPFTETTEIARMTKTTKTTQTATNKSEDFSRASTRKICPKRGPRKSHENATKKPRKSHEKGPNTVFSRR